MSEEKLNPSVKSILMESKNNIHSFAKRKSRLSKGIVKSHYKYLKTISK